MKKTSGLPLFLFIALQASLSANAQVSNEHHELCKEAKDYLGCIKAMKGDDETSAPSKNMSVDIDMIRSTGNRCPSTMAYTGAGYCEKIICIPNYRGHDYRLGGKGWTCKGGNTLQFDGAPVRATTDERCPLVEPELGRNNSCQNGLSEDELESGYGIYESKAQTKIAFGYVFSLIDGERALVLDKVFPGCAAARAGLIKGDKITSINGRSFSLGKNQGDLKFVQELSKEKTAQVTYEREGTSYTKNIKPTSCKFPAYRMKYNSNTGETIFLD